MEFLLLFKTLASDQGPEASGYSGGEKSLSWY
jgi:hypothetical protein